MDIKCKLCKYKNVMKLSFLMCVYRSYPTQTYFWQNFGKLTKYSQSLSKCTHFLCMSGIFARIGYFSVSRGFFLTHYWDDGSDRGYILQQSGAIDLELSLLSSSHLIRLIILSRFIHGYFLMSYMCAPNSILRINWLVFSFPTSPVYPIVHHSSTTFLPCRYPLKNYFITTSNESLLVHTEIWWISKGTSF